MNPARLNTHRSAYGDIVVTKTDSNSRYSVSMDTDGAIDVKHGDWLSKYSSAMYNDFKHIHEFARIDKSGKLKKILLVNHIFAGETIYHLPTYKEAHPLRLDAIEIIGSPYSEEQEDQIMIDTLKEDYDLKGERLEWLKEIADGAHIIATDAEVGEIVGEALGWIVEETAVAAGIGTAVTTLSLIATALMPIGMGIIILNAHDTDKRIAGMQAVNYTIAAWAFGDPIPGFPASLRRNVMAGTGPGAYGLQGLESAWQEASDAAVRNLEQKVRKAGRSKQSYQLFWRAIGKGERKELARRLMQARAEEIHNVVEQRSFLGLDPDNYPN
jgi:hypothetical protein